MSVFEFASDKGFDKSAHFNPQTCLSFRCLFLKTSNVQTISCAVSGLVGFFRATCIGREDTRQNGKIVYPIKETTEMSRAPFFTMETSLKVTVLLPAHWIFNSRQNIGKQHCVFV